MNEEFKEVKPKMAYLELEKFMEWVKIHELRRNVAKIL